MYYGHDATSTLIHPDLKDNRVPKNALDIILWRPGIENVCYWQEASECYGYLVR